MPDRHRHSRRVHETPQGNPHQNPHGSVGRLLVLRTPNVTLCVSTAGSSAPPTRTLKRAVCSAGRATDHSATGEPGVAVTVKLTAPPAPTASGPVVPGDVPFNSTVHHNSHHHTASKPSAHSRQRTVSKPSAIRQQARSRWCLATCCSMTTPTLITVHCSQLPFNTKVNHSRFPFEFDHRRSIPLYVAANLGWIAVAAPTEGHPGRGCGRGEARSTKGSTHRVGVVLFFTTCRWRPPPRPPPGRNRP